MDLLLHVGLHKTGTTAVQVALNQSDAALRDHGILYPRSGLFSSQHALIPGSLLPTHPFLDQCDRRLDPGYYLDLLRAELEQVKPKLVIMSSEVFSEIIWHEACVELLGSIAGLFERTSLLVTLRQPKPHALSALKHVVRDGVAHACLNPVKTYRETLAYSQSCRELWRRLPYPVVERYLEDSGPSLLDHFFGEAFDAACPGARKTLLEEDLRTRARSPVINADPLQPFISLVLFLLGNTSGLSASHVASALPFVHSALAREPWVSTTLGRLTNAHLMAYLENDHLADATNPPGDGEVPMAVKIKALHQAGVSPLEVGALLTLADTFKRSLAAGGSTDQGPPS